LTHRCLIDAYLTSEFRIYGLAGRAASVQESVPTPGPVLILYVWFGDGKKRSPREHYLEIRAAGRAKKMLNLLNDSKCRSKMTAGRPEKRKNASVDSEPNDARRRRQ
jgi:hypothetical protein